MAWKYSKVKLWDRAFLERLMKKEQSACSQSSHLVPKLQNPYALSLYWMYHT